jgi:hypothetical protein
VATAPHMELTRALLRVTQPLHRTYAR